MDATRQDAFGPEERWASAYLAVLKTSSCLFPVIDNVEDTLTWCLEYALRLQNKCGLVQLTYLDEVGRVSTAIPEMAEFNMTHRSKSGYGSTVLPFLGITALFNMGQYVRIKAKTATREEIKAAKHCLVATDWKEHILPQKAALEASINGDYKMTTRALNKKFWKIVNRSRYSVQVKGGQVILKKWAMTGYGV